MSVSATSVAETVHALLHVKQSREMLFHSDLGRFPLVLAAFKMLATRVVMAELSTAIG
ncbi:hypothetical protein SAMN06265222_102260 [Neorhodopirellula lusitana]|uniref:Transposase n=1 Tax=Neorhodopirellula lusitana TaxID=445327 RepID=A0ABY1PU83_9BACT|nr:hypothetical protein SAMN06265222_102260 [Neorhodopirellula lusitana]